MKIDFPKKEDIKDERYFQIRAYDRAGDGSSMAFAVSQDTTAEDVFNIASEEWSVEMDKRQKNYDEYYVKIAVPVPKWMKTVKVVEVVRSVIDIKKPSKNGIKYYNDWKAKRSGLKFKLELSTVRAKYGDGRIAMARRYRLQR